MIEGIRSSDRVECHKFDSDVAQEAYDLLNKGDQDFESLLYEFNDFLKINPKIIEKREFHKIPINKLKRFLFFYKEIVTNRYIAVKPYQLCCTCLGEKYSVHCTTIIKWLKSLINLRVIKIVSNRWIQGSFSKTYKINKNLLNFFNEYNGYADKYPVTHWKNLNRNHAEKKFPRLTYQMSDAVRLASTYLGCQEQYIEAVKRLVPTHVLKCPRENNLYEFKHLDFFHAYNYVVKKQKVQGEKLTYKKFDRMLWTESFDEAFNGDADCDFDNSFISTVGFKKDMIKFCKTIEPMNLVNKEINPKEYKRLRKYKKAIAKMINLSRVGITNIVNDFKFLTIDNLLESGPNMSRG